MISSQAIVTVSNSKFLKGTLVLFYSIIKHNPWFKGDFIVIESGLSESEKQQLAVFNRIKIIQPSSNLFNQLAILCHYFPTFESIKPRFFSLEAFGLTEYEQILFLDSDMLCKGSIQQLFDKNQHPIRACYDYPYYLNKKRDFDTFSPTSLAEQAPNGIYINAFNSGMMAIDMGLLPSNTYIELLKQLNPITYSNLKTSHTDQFVLNRYFQGMVEFVSLTYNFLSHAQQAIEEKSAEHIIDATLIHFSKSPKPWDTNADFSKAHFKLWNMIYTEFVTTNE